jgi:xylulokinase
MLAMHKTPVIIGLDLSTTGSKAVAFADDGTVVAQTRRRISRSNPLPGWQEQDPEEWWRATCEALTDLSGRLAAQNAEPVGLGITHQRETFACLDKDGSALRPAIMWIDTRAAEQIARLGNRHVHEVSGKPPSTTPSLYKLAWLAEHEPDVLHRADLILDVHGYLGWRLTGERLTSWACADPTGLVDMATFTWSPELLGLAGITEDQLPGLVPPGTVMGAITDVAAAVTGLPVGLPVVAGAGDGQCAGLGAAALTPSVAYLNMGTGLTLGVHSDRYLAPREFRTLASPLAGAYTIEALLASGALSIAWFRDHVSGLPADSGSREARLSDMATTVPPGARGLLYLPYLTSAESPHWDPSARACFIGLTDSHGRAEMYRAVLEGLAYEEKLNLALLEQATGHHIDHLVAMGGAAQSELLTQLIADVLEQPIRIAAEPETTALGAAILVAAAVGMDGTSDIQDHAQRMSRIATIREPDPAHRERYRATFAVYRDAYPALKELFPRLAMLRQPATPAGVTP